MAAALAPACMRRAGTAGPLSRGPCVAGVIKVALALEYGLMPGNLHYHRDTPNPESEGLRDGTLEVGSWKLPPSFLFPAPPPRAPRG